MAWLQRETCAYDESMTQGVAFYSRTSALYDSGNTYAVVQGNAHDPYAIEWDGDEFATHKVGTNPLSGDSHGRTSLVKDNDGFFHAFYGCHLTEIQYARSSSSAWPTQTTGWDDQPATPGGSYSTYPKAFIANDGAIYLFLRSGASISTMKMAYTKTTDAGGGGANVRGDSWSSNTNFADWSSDDLQLGYFTICHESSTPVEGVHIAWLTYDRSGGTEDEERHDVFYAFLALETEGDYTEGNLYSAGGTDLGTEISHTEGETYCFAYDSGADTVDRPLVKTLSGTLYIVFQDTTNDYVKMAVWGGSSWAVSTVSTSHTFSGGDFIPHSASDIDVYANDSTTGALVRLNYDGDSWSVAETIITTTVAGEDEINCQVVSGSPSENTIIISGSESGEYTQNDKKIFFYRV